MKGFKNDSDDGIQGRISRGVQMRGDVLFADVLFVEGKVSGKLTSDNGSLQIEQSGEVHADIDVGICVIRGSVKGNVTCKSRAEIYKTGRVEGDIHSPVLLVEEGAILSGAINMSTEPTVAGQTPAQSERADIAAELRISKGAS